MMASGGEIFTIHRDHLLNGLMTEGMAEEVTAICIGISNIRQLQQQPPFQQRRSPPGGDFRGGRGFHQWGPGRGPPMGRGVEIKDGVLEEEAVLLLSGETEEKDQEILILIMVDMGGVGD